jgi:hypothetical protein
LERKPAIRVRERRNGAAGSGEAHLMADGGEVCVVSITGYAFRYTAPESLRDVALGSLRARHIRH